MSAADETQTIVTPLEVTSHVPAAADAAPPEPDSRRAETSYVVLEKSPTPGEIRKWEVVAEYVVARSADAAVRAHVETLDDPTDWGNGSTFVAVPARSWKPVRVKPKTVTTLEIEEA